jgi:hypothetical protein
VLLAYKRFLKDARHKPFYIHGDDYFSARDFVHFNDNKDIYVYTNVADDEHVTEGDPLGILDRCVQTLRSMIEKRIHATDDPKWTEWLSDVIHDYNNNPHATLKDKTPDEVYNSTALIHARWVEDSVYNMAIQKELLVAFKPGDFVRMRLKKGKFEKGATQTMSLEVFQVEDVRGMRVALKTYPEGRRLARPAKPNELVKVDKPYNAPVPKAIATAKKQAKQARKLAAEGLPVPQPSKRVEGDQINDVAQVGQLAIVDAEGAEEDSSRLTLTDGQKVGYVYAGIVTKVTTKLIYMKLLERTSITDTSITQKRLKLSSKTQAISNTHKDALLFTGDAPRIRSDGTTSIPALVIDAVRKEYVFSS